MQMLRRHWPLLLILLLAAALRIYRLDAASLWIDETFSLQSSAGRGWFVDDIPRAQVLNPAPRPISITAPPPPGSFVGIYKTQLTDTNPPLYYMLLRLWRDFTPQNDFFYRMPSVFASLLTVAAMYAAITAAFGRTLGILAALLATFSCLQIEFAQEVRPYATGAAFAAVCLALLFRIEVHGFTLRRGIAMGLSAVAAMCSLYLAAVPIFAIGVYSATTLRGPTRNRVLLTGLAAVLLTLLLVGPLLYYQWPWLTSRNLWLLSPEPRTLAYVIEDTARVVYGELAPINSSSLIAAYASCVIILALAIPLWIHVPRSRVFTIWAVLSIGILSYWDYSGGKLHLQTPRYTLAAGPGVFGLIIALGALARQKTYKLLAAIPFAALLLTLISLPLAWDRTKEPIKEITTYAREGHLRPTDLVVVATSSNRNWENVLYLALDAYVPGDFVGMFLTPQKPVKDYAFIREEAERRGGIVLFVESGAPFAQAIPPGWQRESLLNFQSMGYLSTFRPPTSSTTRPSATRPSATGTTAPAQSASTRTY